MADANRTGTAPPETSSPTGHAPAAAGLAQLRHAHPEGWSFWATQAGGRPLLVAEHDDGGLISARSPEALDAKIISLVEGGL